MEKKKIVLPVVCLLIILCCLTGCETGQSSDVAGNVPNEENTSGQEVLGDSKIAQLSSTENNGDQKISNDVQVEKKLVVDGNRCRGCGRCAQIASAVFSMQNRKAVVVTQEQNDLSAVQKAIASCPAGAINLS